MRLAIFGGTGRTGKHLVTQALAAGHAVTALARTPDRLAGAGDRLQPVPGDVRDADAVARTVAGAAAVLSVLGPTANRPDYQVSQGTQHILNAMAQHGVPRLIISAGAGVRDPRDTPGLVDRFFSGLVRRLLAHGYEDMVRTVDLVRQSDVRWTVVRVPMLNDEPATGRITIGYVGQGMGLRLSRADLAAFMLAQVNSLEYVGQAPAISN